MQCDTSLRVDYCLVCYASRLSGLISWSLKCFVFGPPSHQPQSLLFLNHPDSCTAGQPPFHLELYRSSSQEESRANYNLAIWEVNSELASQEVLRLIWNHNVHHRVHKSPPPVPILSQMNPVNTLQHYFHKINFSIILSTLRSSEWSLSFRLSNQHSVRISLRNGCWSLNLYIWVLNLKI
jgi:hypothetical protein